MKTKIFLYLVLLFGILLVFIALSKSLQAQELKNEPKYKPTAQEIVVKLEYKNRYYIVTTVRTGAVNSLAVNKYIVSTNIYYFLKKKDLFNSDFLVKLFRKNPNDRKTYVWKITRKL